MKIVGLQDGFILTVAFVAGFGMFSWRSLQERETVQGYTPHTALLGANAQDRSGEFAQGQSLPARVQSVAMDAPGTGQDARSGQATVASMGIARDTGLPVAMVNGKRMAGRPNHASTAAGIGNTVTEVGDADAGEGSEYGQEAQQQVTFITNHYDGGLGTEAALDSTIVPVEDREQFTSQEENLSAYKDKSPIHDYLEPTDAVDDYDDRSTTRPDYEDVYPGCPAVLPPSSNEQMAAERLALYGCVYYTVCELPTDVNPVVCTWYLNHKI